MPANPLPLVGLAGHDLIWSATLSASDDDTEFPIQNAQTDDPALLCKGVANTLNITITTASATPVAIALIQTNAETGTLDGQAITFPGLDSEGQRIHPWKLLAGLSPGTSRTLVLSKASGVVFVGRICLLTELQELNVKYGWERGRFRPADIEIPTRGGSLLYHSFGVRTKWAQGVVDLHEDETMLSSLDLSAKGKTLPMLFIPDEATNEAWFARQSTPYSVGIPNIDVRETKLRFDEVSCGPVNG